ncbi:hypothetical protein BDZ88DRAFT_508527 [Geranomyces variabilis]|nr:hypothetical protein BDZ88DRAFT_508527 [Geranomyces variabilis]KAJ3137740.1 hypothetical protein HDU90_001691 [Geranomyces variabilis]
MSNYFQLEQGLQEALTRIRLILDSTRNPVRPSDVPHHYADKYHLADFLTNAAFNAHLTCLAFLGWNDEAWQLVRDWVAAPPDSRTGVLLRFESEEVCEFVRADEHVIESPSVDISVTIASVRTGEAAADDRGDPSVDDVASRVQHKVVTRVKHYVYLARVRYRLSLSSGSITTGRRSIILGEAERSAEIISTVQDTPPIPLSNINDPVDLDVTFALSQLSGDDSEPFKFQIDRTNPECATPRRNPDIEKALTYFKAFGRWAELVHNYFCYTLARMPGHPGTEIDVSAATGRGTFVPVVPLFEKRADSESVLLSPTDLSLFLDEQKRSLNERFAIVDRSMPDRGYPSLVTATEGKLMVTLSHSMSLASTYFASITEIEEMLRQQLIDAIGRTVKPEDFSKLVQHQNRKLFKADYQPRPFSFPVQRPNHSPEGVVSIDFKSSGGSWGDSDDETKILESHSRTLEDHESPAMYIPLSAATRVPILGKRTLHACLFHRFSNSMNAMGLSLRARARQFSSFILLAGRVASASEFQPTAALIVQNKDDLTIALNLETLPTAQEFAEAVESLSPEQRAFAKAVRALQLQATLFALCVVEIKPQLELLLNLPEDALTKEIKLTQDLMQLFVKYQIPSDLLRYENLMTGADAPVATRLAAVKEYVANIQSMIKDAGKEEIDEAKARAQAAVYNQVAQSPARTGSYGFGSPASQGGGFGGAAPRQGLFGTSAALQAFGSVAEDLLRAPLGAQMASSPSYTPTSPGYSPTSAAYSPASPSYSPASPSNSSDRKYKRTAPAMPKMAPRVAAGHHEAAKTDSQVTTAASQPTQTDMDEQASGDDFSEVADPRFDFTTFPSTLDSRLRDAASAVRPTIISLGDSWTRTRAASVLAQRVTEGLTAATRREEKNAAFDLLDALSRSGAEPLRFVHLHVVCAATHAFDETLLDTVLKKNENPLASVALSERCVAEVAAGCKEGEGGKLLMRGGN